MSCAQPTTTTPSKETILNALLAFTDQRSGIDWRNYYSSWSDAEGVRAFRSEQKEIGRDGRDARELIRAVRLRSSITADALLDRSLGGRLSFDQVTGKWEYVTGQYFPTEYRSAVCRLLAQVLWGYARSNGYDTREKIQKWARGEFGRGIASRWFD